jgi:hypothetical protein
MPQLPPLSGEFLANRLPAPKKPSMICHMAFRCIMLYTNWPKFPSCRFPVVCKRQSFFLCEALFEIGNKSTKVCFNALYLDPL